MGDKRIVTLISLSLILDGVWAKDKFEQLCIPKIRSGCHRQGSRYAPSVWVDTLETKEMEIIPGGIL